jgi:16S rRNA G966 N2-methylase RsmD
MLSDNNIKNLSNAKINQNKFNKLNWKNKKIFLKQIYKFYNNSIPIVKYSIKDIQYSFEKLKNKQNYLAVLSNDLPNINYKKYNMDLLSNFINSNLISKSNHNSNLISNETIKKIKNFNDVDLVIVDLDYKKHYIEICALSDFYQNEQRIKCKVLRYQTPYDYYKQNYIKILNKYFSNQSRYYENGLQIDLVSFNNLANPTNPTNPTNPIYLQNIIYENNKFCTVYKPYLFKLFIQLFSPNNSVKTKILDLSAGWGDRLVGALSIQDQIEKYIGIDPNEKLFEGYLKMVKDLSKKENTKKFILLNKPAEEVDYKNLDIDFDIIFWSPPFFDLELYVNDSNRLDLSKQSIVKFNKYEEWEDLFLINVINISSNNLKKNGVILLYLGHINYKTFFQKMTNIKKIKYIGNIGIYGDKLKKYILFVKI